jgi:hypothetical protein
MTRMAQVRAWHPVRLALVCAMLAVAGGAPAARGQYAEVSARAAAVVRAEAERDAALAPSPAPSHARVALVVTAPAASPFVPAPLYLAHCALLL